jgi:ADP-ribose pyrophosphatase YjhB (NUDIX family)
MAKRSAGILMHRRGAAGIELLLVHPGGPFWASKDHGAWSIPKGEYDAEEEPLACAIREFAEELGIAPHAVDAGAFLELGELVQPSRKVITAFAAEGDLRSGQAQAQYLRDGMAAEERAEAILSRGRPRRVVCTGRSARKDSTWAIPLHRSPACDTQPQAAVDHRAPAMDPRRQRDCEPRLPISHRLGIPWRTKICRDQSSKLGSASNFVTSTQGLLARA